MKQIHIKLSETLHWELRIYAAVKGQTLQDYVVDAIKDKIAFDQSNSVSALAFPKELSNDNDTK